jgi:adenylate cyclase
MTRILVADDEVDLERLIKQKFRKQIREKEYEFLFVPNGKEALRLLQEDPAIDLVLSDINMPEMDGLTLLGELATLSPILKTVIISAYGDMGNIRMAMNKGAFDFICKPFDLLDLEVTIEKTIRHVHQIKDTLQAIKENNILRMYVDETVLNFMNTREFEHSLMVNETINASVVFIDICQFTAITETEPADKVVRLLNKYFDLMVKEIIAQSGYVDKFIGDALLAVFRGDFHLDRAIDAALAARAQLRRFAEDAGPDGIAPPISIGVHTGEMISGNIGSSTLRRLDYTVIGDVVNTAQRLRGAADPGQIIIAETSYQQIKESFNCARLREVTLKNKTAPVVVYEVLD